MTAPSIHQSGLRTESASRRLDRSRIAARRGSTIRESIVIAEPWMMTSDSETHIRVSKFPIGKYFFDFQFPNAQIRFRSPPYFLFRDHPR
jgi:hypothetical protein